MESGSVAGELARGGARRISVASALRVRTRDAVRVTREFDLPPERIFGAWLDPAIAGNWLFATASRPTARVEIDARVGGAFRIVEGYGGGRFEHCGEYIELVHPRRLAFTLAGDGRTQSVMLVSVEIAPLDQGCVLTLTHENVPRDRASFIEARWTGMLYGLSTILDP